MRLLEAPLELHVHSLTRSDTGCPTWCAVGVGGVLVVSVRAGQSAEEIEKFTVDEGLSEYDRAQQLLRKGQPSQRLSVLNCLRSLFDPDNCPGTLKSMVSLIMVRTPRAHAASLCHNPRVRSSSPGVT